MVIFQVLTKKDKISFSNLVQMRNFNGENNYYVLLIKNHDFDFLVFI